MSFIASIPVLGPIYYVISRSFSEVTYVWSLFGEPHSLFQDWDTVLRITTVSAVLMVSYAFLACAAMHLMIFPLFRHAPCVEDSQRLHRKGRIQGQLEGRHETLKLLREAKNADEAWHNVQLLSYRQGDEVEKSHGPYETAHTSHQRHDAQLGKGRWMPHLGAAFNVGRQKFDMYVHDHLLDVRFGTMRMDQQEMLKLLREARDADEAWYNIQRLTFNEDQGADKSHVQHGKGPSFEIRVDRAFKEIFGTGCRELRDGTLTDLEKCLDKVIGGKNDYE